MSDCITQTTFIKQEFVIMDKEQLRAWKEFCKTLTPKKLKYLLSIAEIKI